MIRALGIRGFEVITQNKLCFFVTVEFLLYIWGKYGVRKWYIIWDGDVKNFHLKRDVVFCPDFVFKE